MVLNKLFPLFQKTSQLSQYHIVVRIEIFFQVDHNANMRGRISMGLNEI